MANRFEILKEIKNLIFSDTPAETKFKDAKVGDLIIRVDGEEFVEGQQVSIVTEDGVIPASPEMAGEHVLEDGTKIVLDENAVIVSVEAPTEELEAPVEEELEEVKEEEMTDEVKEELKEEIKEELAEEVGDDKVAELTSRIEMLEAQIEEMLALTKDTAQFSSDVKEKLNSFVADTPAEEKFKSIKSQYKSDIKKNVETKNDRLEGLRKFRLKK